MPPELETLRLAEAEGVLTIELHRPERLNALTEQVARDLRAALDHAARDEIRAVVLTGAGRAFSSGADLRSMGSPGDDGRVDLARSLREHFNAPVRALRDLPKPVVAAVNGPAVGIAVSYALACDHVLAARSAYFLLSFVNIGLAPDGGLSALIPARAGAGRFAELALLGERLPAERALAWGLVDRMCEDGELLSQAAALAGRLAAGATGAQAAIKRMVNAGPLAGLDAALALEAELQGARGDDPEFHEGVAAFLDKRAPRFGDAARAT
jgi:2-(1,2-epoxy-1,2-dihydrophenyl)acetyl-CoA isomerase